MAPKISIIIPCFNAEEHLKACLDSVLTLNVSKEIILIDGNSKDGTHSILEHFVNDIHHLIIEPDNGIYDAMNKGAQLASGEWLYFMGTDDKLLSQGMERLLHGERKGEVLRIGEVEIVDREHSKVPSFYPAKWGTELYWRNVVHHQGVIYHQSVFEELQYDLRFSILADYHLNLKLFMHDSQASLINEKVAICGGTGVSKQFEDELYRQELTFKSELLSGWRKQIMPAWIRMKQQYKNS
ncbi:MAG: glycosyltransferase [Flavobacteriales bacterium]|nr:glycosyltransferase [Flavobacteriales bacterium]